MFGETGIAIVMTRQIRVRRIVLLSGDSGDDLPGPGGLFLLERLLEQGLPDRTLMTAFGPGFTCSGLLLEAPRIAA